MFKKIFSILVLSLVIFFSKNVLAQENRGGFVIDNFEVDILVNQDSTPNVSEKIEVNFSERRHGIFRDIPIKYKNDQGFEYNMKLKILSVENENGEPYKFQVSRQGNNKRIKIGDPNFEVIGEQIYLIDYEIERGIRYFEEHDELYWNPIGTAWPTSISKASARVIFEEGVDFISGTSLCYTGTMGSQEKNCSVKEGDGEVLFKSTQLLNPYEGLTIVLNFPKGEIYQPTSADKFWLFMADNWGFLIPVLVFILMFIVWFLKGKDEPFKKTLIAQYEVPDNLTPGEVGYLMKERYNGRFLAGDIVNLAVKGYLKIEEIEKNSFQKFFKAKPEYQFEKIKDWKKVKDLTGHEKGILKGVFQSESIGSKIKLSDRKDFYQYKKEIDHGVKDQIKERQYFSENIFNQKYLYIIFIILILGVAYVGIFQTRFDIFIGGIMASLLILFFKFIMSKKTSKGAEAYWKAKGFKHYIDVAENDRSKFYAKENMFEQVLPYAIVFGNVDKWAKAFEGIVEESPNWYSGASTFSVIGFSNSLNNGIVSSSNSASSSPSSSGSGGSGFSGGGGGGGGGGSW
jgi:hypothetical protein